jgi:hypothetical protein
MLPEIPILKIGGRRLTKDHLELMKSVDSEDEGSPLKTMKSPKGRAGSNISPLP